MLNTLKQHNVTFIKNIFISSYREIGARKSPSLYWRVSRIQHCLFQGKHELVQRLALNLVKEKHYGIGNLYLAHSYFLLARYEEAAAALKALLVIQPEHAEATYLLAQVYVLQHKKEQAWQLLEKLSLISKRLKTWLYISQLVDNQTDFERMKAGLQQAQRKGLLPIFHKHLNEYLAQAALRAANYDQAKVIWRETIQIIQAQARDRRKNKKTKNSYSTSLAEKALKDLKDVFLREGISFFLVSGTLLGCVREGRLLGHDKDLDVGIWEDVALDEILRVLRSSGLFYVLPQRSAELIRVKHVNGMPIDVFYHYKTERSYWHGGVKVKWHNSPFELKETIFLNSNYLIPADSDTYLTENYGDWRTPKIIFDNVYDTPNVEVINNEELIIHNYKSLLKALLKNNTNQIQVLKQRLMALGEPVL